MKTYQLEGSPSSYCWMACILLCLLTDYLMAADEAGSTSSSGPPPPPVPGVNLSDTTVAATTNATNSMAATTPKPKKTKEGNSLMMTVAIIAVVIVLAIIIAISSFLSKKSTKTRKEDDQPMPCQEYYLSEDTLTDLSRVQQLQLEDDQAYSSGLRPIDNPLFRYLPNDGTEMEDSASIASVKDEIVEGDHVGNKYQSEAEGPSADPTPEEDPALARAVPRVTLGQGMYGAIEEEDEEDPGRSPRETSESPRSNSHIKGDKQDSENAISLTQPSNGHLIKTQAEVILNPETVQRDAELV